MTKCPGQDWTKNHISQAMKLTCNACGRWVHEMSKCNLKDHPDAIKVRQSGLNQSKGKENGKRGYSKINKG